jgi:hypothetical protein
MRHRHFCQETLSNLVAERCNHTVTQAMLLSQEIHQRAQFPQVYYMLPLNLTLLNGG